MNTLHLICSQGDRQRLRQVVDGGEDDAEEQLGHVEDLAAPADRAGRTPLKLAPWHIYVGPGIP